VHKFMKILLVTIVMLLSFFVYSQANAQNFRGPTGFRITLVSAGTAQAFSSNQILTGDLVVQAEAGNTSNVIIGGSNVLLASSNGIILTPGDSAAFENLFPGTSKDFYDLSVFFFDGGTNGDAIIITRIQ